MRIEGRGLAHGVTAAPLDISSKMGAASRNRSRIQRVDSESRLETLLSNSPQFHTFATSMGERKTGMPPQPKKSVIEILGQSGSLDTHEQVLDAKHEAKVR